MSNSSIPQRLLETAVKQFQHAIEEQIRIFLSTVETVCQCTTSPDEQLDVQLLINEIKEAVCLINNRLHEAVQQYMGYSAHSEEQMIHGNSQRCDSLFLETLNKLSVVGSKLCDISGGDLYSSPNSMKKEILDLRKTSRNPSKKQRYRKRKNVPLKLKLDKSKKSGVNSTDTDMVSEEDIGELHQSAVVLDGSCSRPINDIVCIKNITDEQHKRSDMESDDNAETSDTEVTAPAPSSISRQSIDAASNECQEKLNGLDEIVSMINAGSDKGSTNSSETTSNLTVPRSYACTLCDEAFRSKYYLKQHLQKSHAGDMNKNMCVVCKKPFATESDLSEHVKIHKKKRNCDICKKTFSSSSRYRDHLGTRAHYNKKQEFLQSGMSQVDAEIIDEDPTLTFPNAVKICSICGQRFSGKTSLYNHMNSIHSTNTDFMCHICGKSWNCKAKLSAHMDIHLKRYKCDLCGESFSRKRLRDAHRRIHTGEQPFKCPHCAKTFREGYLLRKHVKTHSSLRPFTCDVCHAKFKLKGHLQRHVAQVHSTEKPHKCDQCTESFAEKRLLQKHLFQHTGQSEVRCSFCGKFLASRQSLNTHLMQYHKQQQPEAAATDVLSQATECQASIDTTTALDLKTTATTEYTLNDEISASAAAYLLQPSNGLQPFIVSYPQVDCQMKSDSSFESQVVLQGDSVNANGPQQLLIGNTYQQILTESTTESERQLLQNNHALARLATLESGAQVDQAYGAVFQFKHASEQLTNPTPGAS